eukprot:403342635
MQKKISSLILTLALLLNLSEANIFQDFFRKLDHHHKHQHSQGPYRLSYSNPSKEASQLFDRLQASYGSKILSGQTNNNFGKVHDITGHNPVVQSFDMQNYSPTNPWHDDWSSWDDGSVQQAIDWYQSTGGNGIVTFQWHWFSPSGGQLRTSTFYTDQTSFDVNNGVTPGTMEYNLIIRDLDHIAEQLKRLQYASIPVLWRPLHEAGGRWFWWGAKGSDSALKLYYMMRDRFINTHGLNNLIWVWSTPEGDWYPGNNNVDIIGYDSYPGAYNYQCPTDKFNQLKSITGGQKMISLSENGPIPNIADCFNQGSKFLYFLSWADLLTSQNDNQHIQNTYGSELVSKL